MTLPHTFAAGEVLTAAELNENFDDLDGRAPWPVTSTTRPAHAAGRLIYETDTGRLLASSGSAWRAVPIVQQEWTVAEAWSSSPVNYTVGTQGRYATAKRVDDLVFLDAYLRPDAGTTMGATGNLGIIFRLPTIYRPTASRRINGVRWISGASPAEVGDAAALVATDGNVSVGIVAAATAVILSAVYRI